MARGLVETRHGRGTFVVPKVVPFVSSNWKRAQFRALRADRDAGGGDGGAA